MTDPDIVIDAAFDAGNIEVLGIAGATARLAIRKDNLSDFYQWFHFRVSNAQGRALELKLTGLGGSAYPDGWAGYDAVMSEDRETWTRAPSTWDAGADGGTLTVRCTPQGPMAWFAYFAPYSMERHHDLVAQAAQAEGVGHRVLGTALTGRRSIALNWAAAIRRCGSMPASIRVKPWPNGGWKARSIS